MKMKNMLWAALSMTAALVMTACSSNDDNMTETPVAPSTSKTIPYTVTVGGDVASTRATVADDNQTLKFASGDKLYITGTNIQGVLEIQDGVNASSNATFSGTLTYSGSGSPADDLALTATLVSAQQTVDTQVSVDGAGAVTVNYPTSSYCATIGDAVQQYSRLTGTSTYGDKTFTLTQQTAFLNFEITFNDGTATNTTLSAVVSNGGAAICTANVTTVTDGGIKAKFVLPVAAGTTLSSATVKMGDKETIAFGASQTLTGKVYNVKKTQAYIMAANATANDKGKLICTAGHIHAYNADAECTADRVAKIIYVGATGNDTYSHGLALAMSDASGGKWKTSSGFVHDYKTSNSGDFSSIIEDGLQYNASHNNDSYPAFMNAIANNGTAVPTDCSGWFLPTGYQWQLMITAAGGFADLRNGFTSVGGTNMASEDYWSSTERSDSYMHAWGFSSWWNEFRGFGKDSQLHVRSALAF